MQNITNKEQITAIYESGNYNCSYYAKINSVTYPQSQFYSIKTSQSLFGSSNKPTVGNVIAKEITIELKNPTDTIPKMAKIEPFVVVNKTGQEVSYEAAKGVFYIDTREVDKKNNKLTITGYDKILMLDQSYISQYTEPKRPIEIVTEICNKVGITFSSTLSMPKTTALVAAKIQFTAGTYTMREVLGFIAAKGLGNYVLTDDGTETLRFVPLCGANSSATDYGLHNVGSKASSYEVGETLTYDGIHAYYDDNEYTYPLTAISYPFELSYPDFTSIEVRAQYNLIKDWEFKNCNVSGMIINPIAEVGDFFTITKGEETVTYQLFNSNANFQRLFNIDTNSAISSEVEHEYVYTSSEKKEWIRRLRSTASEFTVKTNEISAKVTENTTNITGNTESIAANTSAIAQNTEDIAANAQDISETANKLSELTVNVNGVSATVSQIQDDIEEGTENIIPYPYCSEAQTINGVTFSFNLDGSINVSGTATAAFYFYLVKFSDAEDAGIGTYYISNGIPSAINGLSIMWGEKAEGETSWHLYGNGATKGQIIREVTTPSVWQLYYYIRSGTTFDDTVVLTPAVYKNNYSSFDNWKSPVKSAASKFVIQSGLIASKVSTTDFTGNTVASLINQTATTIKISANKVNLSGYVTVSDLSGSGTTTINGSNITTGTIAAERLELTDYVTIGDLKTSGKTTINGSNITTGTINANLITAGTLSADRISGGTIKLGGFNGMYGIMDVYDVLDNLRLKIGSEGSFKYYTDGQFIASEYTVNVSGNIIHEINAKSGKITSYELNFGTGVMGCYHINSSTSTNVPWWTIFIDSNGAHLNLYDSSGNVRASL